MKIKRGLKLLALVAVLSLFIAACGDGGADSTTTTGADGDTTTTAGDTTTTGEGETPGTTDPPEEGELGSVTIGAGEPVIIASIQTISGATASLGQDQVDAIEVAIADRGGELLGHPIELQSEDGLCSADGGSTAAEAIVANPQVVGILGTSCSGAGVPASQIMSEAGLVMISGSNTSPSLTALPYLADEPLEAQENWNPGYFRTAHNDEFQGAGAATFAAEDLGASTAVTIHDGDPYTQGLTTQFGEFFTGGGGEVVLATAVNKGDTDMRPILQEIEALAPDVLFMPIFQPEADFIVQQIGEFPGLADTQLMGADGILSDTFVVLPESEGMVFSGPGQAAGSAYEDFVAKYEEAVGTPPIQAFHAHAYDAANMLFDAIEAVAQEDGDSLVIDRAALRQYLYDLEGFEGLTGTLACNEFGDCANPAIGIFRNDDPSAGILGVLANVVGTANLAEQVDPEKLN
ncbi:MAG TPA: branched-chain amino acid ABC transporter substrate-binding protein [Acidimicrobiia bacterium]|nr:branched-chain amino acid ABC transporter substrate-binding protein [Acidimicrobiia bacterium]